MGIEERDYYRQPTGGGAFGNFRTWSVTGWLIAINLVLLVLCGIPGPTNGLIERYGDFSVSDAIYHGEVWQFITFQFIHGGPGHALMNMIFLYCFGPMVEPYLGSRRYLAFYLLCGIGGALIFIPVSIFVLGPTAQLLGASAGIFGLIVAAMRISPLSQVRLIFPLPIVLTIQQVGWICIGLSGYLVMVSKFSQGGQASHLGGVLVGYVLIRNVQWLDIFHRQTRMKYGGRRVTQRDWSKNF